MADTRAIADESAEEFYESAPCGYVSTTPEGVIVRVNRTLAQMSGADQEQLIGKHFSDLLTVGGRIFYETHIALMLRLHGSVNEIALDFQHGDGAVLPTLVTAIQKRDGAGITGSAQASGRHGRRAGSRER